VEVPPGVVAGGAAVDVEVAVVVVVVSVVVPVAAGVVVVVVVEVLDSPPHAVNEATNAMLAVASAIV
jgi:hypothetical protein